MSSPSGNSISCHYDILSVDQKADVATIKKAHRKLALKFHPDKNLGENEASAEQQFRFVQQAYECLSDPIERKWYDEHRDAILKGWTAGANGMNSNNGDGSDMHILFDVVPFTFSGCYSGYGNDKNGDSNDIDNSDDSENQSESEKNDFYTVFQHVFEQVHEGEQQGWINMGNIEDMPYFLPTDFGNSDSDWTDIVSVFYTAWDSFASCLNFSWADKYDVIRDAPNRRIKRAMEDENKKARRLARKQRNEEIAALVHFVKRRDPRVERQQERNQLIQQQLLQDRKLAVQKKKKDNQKQRDEWRKQAAIDMAQAEEEDRKLGRVRLADDSDEDYDYGGGSGKGKKKKKNRRGKKKDRGKNQQQENEQEDDEHNEDRTQPDQTEVKDESAPITNNETVFFNCTISSSPKSTAESDDNANGVDAAINMDTNVVIGDATARATSTGKEDTSGNTYLEEDDEDNSEISESASEPEFWRCDICRKDFKSQAQLENHLKSKKHKDALKKYEQKVKNQQQRHNQNVMDEIMMDDMVLG